MLSRKKSEQIRIGTDISLTIVEIRGDKVRIGINAPSDVQVHRAEVFNAIQLSGMDRVPTSPVKPSSLEDKTILALIDVLIHDGYSITDEIQQVIARCSSDFSDLIFLVKGHSNAS